MITQKPERTQSQWKPSNVRAYVRLALLGSNDPEEVSSTILYVFFISIQNTELTLSPGPLVPGAKMHPEKPGNKYFSSFGRFWVINFPPYFKWSGSIRWFVDNQILSLGEGKGRGFLNNFKLSMLQMQGSLFVP